MKSLSILFTLFLITFARNKNCSCKFDDSFFLRGEYFGSATSSANHSRSISLIGMTELAILYVEGNHTASMLMQNTTTNGSDSVTGKEILHGWFWELITSTGLYTMSKFNGRMDGCEKHYHMHIPKYSQIVQDLYQIFPSENSTGSENVICQGYVEDSETIDTLIFQNAGGNTKLILSNSLSKGSSDITTNVQEVRPLGSNDSHLFYNPCTHAKPTNRKVKLYQSMDGKSRISFPHKIKSLFSYYQQQINIY